MHGDVERAANFGECRVRVRVYVSSRLACGVMWCFRIQRRSWIEVVPAKSKDWGIFV